MKGCPKKKKNMVTREKMAIKGHVLMIIFKKRKMRKRWGRGGNNDRTFNNGPSSDISWMIDVGASVPSIFFVLFITLIIQGVEWW